MPDLFEPKAGWLMLKESKREILIVDDDDGVRNSLGLILQMAGYEVSLAQNGFDALLQLKRRIPAIVLSDLNMPEMSGFELLSVVRRRFPQISVIAMSGAYQTGDAVIGGVIADAFFAKGQCGPQALLKTIANLLGNAEPQLAARPRESAPVWISRNGKDSEDIPYVVLTCTDCLRSFPLSVTMDDPEKIQETACLYCSNMVRYVIDFSVAMGSSSPEACLASTARHAKGTAVGCMPGD
jgi:CheY-like chemotaxis protein